jgi:peptidoglycan/LPS O-acetylase OafA/YrhL
MDACRALAALAIVVGHSYTGGPAGTLIDFASQFRVGVPVFFALSGFLLFRPYAVAFAHGARAPRWRDYAQRRVLRILPGYWFALTAVALLLGPAYAPGAFSSHWWLFYGLGQVYSLGYAHSGLPVAWSLSTEVSFYLLLPLFAALMARLARKLGWRTSAALVLSLLFMIGPVVRFLGASVQQPTVLHLVQRLTYGLPGELPNFVVGMALAVLSVSEQGGHGLPRAIEWLTRRPTAAWALAAALFAFGATVGAYVRPAGLWSGPLDFRTRFLLDGVLEAAFAGLLILPAAFARSARAVPHRVLTWRPLAFVGVVSYGLYLWHVPLGEWVINHTPLVHTAASGLGAWPVILAVFLATGLAAATASYYFVELPFLARKRGWRLRPDPPSAEAEAEAEAPIASASSASVPGPGLR